MKKVIRGGILVSMLALGTVGWAQVGQQSAVGVTSKRTVLKTFLDADGREKGKPVEVTALAFPVPIYENSKAGYVRIKVAGQDVWLDPDQLVLDAKVDAKCLVTKGQPVPLAGGLRGANEACK